MHTLTYAYAEGPWVGGLSLRLRPFLACPAMGTSCADFALVSCLASVLANRLIL